ncbi:MAG TPA: hypothetical protein VFB01_06335 [Burkholderiales bacterium]|nr:hypothetical protein [Burkholderiales bacterium]
MFIITLRLLRLLLFYLLLPLLLLLLLLGFLLGGGKVERPLGPAGREKREDQEQARNSTHDPATHDPAHDDMADAVYHGQ